MKPVYQTEFGEKGNCFAACVASVLELPIEEVPNFVEFSDWFAFFQLWLIKFGLSSLCLEIEEDRRFTLLKQFCPGYHIAGVNGPRGRKHAVVIHDGKIVWDPMPERFVKVRDPNLIVDVQLFVIQDASKCVRWLRQGVEI